MQITPHRCGLREQQLQRLLPDRRGRRCDGLPSFVGLVGFDSLESRQAERLKSMPTRLSLPSADIDAAIAGGRAATRANPALAAYPAARRGGKP